MEPTQPIQPVLPKKFTLDRIKELLKDIWVSIKSNKKLLYIGGGALGLIILVIILGLIFGQRGIVKVATHPSPTPSVESTPTPAPGDILSQSDAKLLDLKTQINAFDIRQSRLQPPALNFDISF